MLLPETSQPQAMQLAERLRLAIEALDFQHGDVRFRISASFGVARLSMHSRIDDLIAEADDWLYRAKQSGRNRVAGPPVQW